MLFCELTLVVKIDIKERVFAASDYQGKNQNNFTNCSQWVIFFNLFYF